MSSKLPENNFYSDSKRSRLPLRRSFSDLKQLMLATPKKEQFIVENKNLSVKFLKVKNLGISKTMKEEEFILRYKSNN